MPQVKKPMLDKELKYMSDRAKEMLEQDKEAVEEIATAMANQMFLSLFEMAQYHAMKDIADAIREQTSVLKELLAEKPVAPVVSTDDEWKEVFARNQLTTMERALLLAPVPEEFTGIKDTWELWSLAKEARVGPIDTEEDQVLDAPDVAEEVEVKRPSRIRWKGLTEAEQKKVVLDHIDMYFQEYGKLPNSADMQRYYQSVCHKGTDLFGTWKDAVLAYVNL